MTSVKNLPRSDRPLWRASGTRGGQRRLILARTGPAAPPQAVGSTDELDASLPAGYRREVILELLQPESDSEQMHGLRAAYGRGVHWRLPAYEGVTGFVLGQGVDAIADVRVTQSLRRRTRPDPVQA